MADAQFKEPANNAQSPAYYGEALENAERLLQHAAEKGIDVDADTRSAILHARAVPPSAWTEDLASKLLVALTQLAARLKPVTGHSLEASHSETRPTMNNYLVWAIILTAVIIPASIATFVTSSISDAVRGDITKANALAIKLATELGPPARADIGLTEELTELQDYAATVRLIYRRAERLNQFVFPHVTVPLTLQGVDAASFQKSSTSQYQIDKNKKELFELAVGIDDLPEQRNRVTETYQDVRYFAQTILSDISTFYGAINSCILPILYALLGTCAYLLRTFEDQINSRTFVPSHANSARFLIAAIGGTVIGLFGNFTQQTSASPLAIAFLVGYSVEVFFSFLEGLIKAFTKSTAGSSPAAATAGKS